MLPVVVAIVTAASPRVISSAATEDTISLVNAKVPLELGKFIVLSAVGSTTPSIVSNPSSVAPSNFISYPGAKSNVPGLKVATTLEPVLILI